MDRTKQFYWKNSLCIWSSRYISGDPTAYHWTPRSISGCPTAYYWTSRSISHLKWWSPLPWLDHKVHNWRSHSLLLDLKVHNWISRSTSGGPTGYCWISRSISGGPTSLLQLYWTSSRSIDSDSDRRESSRLILHLVQDTLPRDSSLADDHQIQSSEALPRKLQNDSRSANYVECHKEVCLRTQ